MTPHDTQGNPLGDALRSVEQFPLPRCRHGFHLVDGAGERLEPPCGCRAPVPTPEPVPPGEAGEALEAMAEFGHQDTCSTVLVTPLPCDCWRAYLPALSRAVAESDALRRAAETDSGNVARMIREATALRARVAELEDLLGQTTVFLPTKGYDLLTTVEARLAGKGPTEQARLRKRNLELKVSLAAAEARAEDLEAGQANDDRDHRALVEERDAQRKDRAVLEQGATALRARVAEGEGPG